MRLAARLTCYESVPLEIQLGSLGEEDVGLVEEQDTIPPVGQRKVGL